MKFTAYILCISFFVLPTLLCAQFRADCRYIKGKTQNTVLIQPSCYGFSNGFVKMETDFPGINTNDISYQLNNSAFVSSANFSGIRSGTQRIITLNAADGCRDTIFIFVPQPDSIQITISIDTASCQYGGFFLADASGGTGALQYRWNTVPVQTTALIRNINSLSTYTVTVTDVTGCYNSRKATMPKPAPLKVKALIQNIECASQSTGNIILSPQNGTPPYFYKWASDAAGPLNETGNILANLTKGMYFVTVSDATGCAYEASFSIYEPPPLTVKASLKNKSCLNDFSGAIEVSVSGGTPGYTYLWSNNQSSSSIDSLSSGDYQLLVTDRNGCRVDTSFQLRLNYPITGNISAQQISCSDRTDGTATIQLIGGTGPFSYKWSDAGQQISQTAIGLDAGDYSVTATDFLGCLVVGNVSIVKPPPIDVQVVVSPTRCFGSEDGIASLLISGGNGNSNAEWCDGKNGISRNDLKSGSCSVSITDSKGCMVQKSVNIPTPSVVEADQLTITDVKCAGEFNGSAECLAKGGTAPYTYRWNDANARLTSRIDNLPKGNYSVTMTDALQCTGIQTVVINEPLPLLFNVATLSPKCASAKSGRFSALASGGTVPYSFLWKNNNSSGIGSADTTAATGLYSMTVTDGNNCRFVDTFSIRDPKAIDFLLRQVKKGCAGTGKSEAEIANLIGGTPPFGFLWSDGQKGSYVSGLKPGSISVSVTDSNGCVFTKNTNITEYEPILASLAFVKPRCKDSGDGQVGIISLSGGSGNGISTAYTYRWDAVPNQTTPLAKNLPGDRNYTVIITDSSGCSGMATRYLPEPGPMEIQAKINANKCVGLAEGSIEVIAKSDNPGFNYLWNDVSGSSSARLSGLRAGSYTITVSDFNNCKVTATYQLIDPDSIRIIRSIIRNNTCSDTAIGSIQLLTMGGTGALTFKWSNGATSASISGLKNGRYNVSITDQSGCSLIQQFGIRQADSMNIDLIVTPVSCNGYHNGAIRVDINGGTGPFSYSLDGIRFSGFNRFDALSGGQYAVFVKDNLGCLTKSIVAVGEPEALQVDAGADQRITFGSSATLIAGYANQIGKVTVQWIAPSADIFSCNYCDSVVVKPKETTIIILRVTDDNGCQAEDRTTVFLSREKGIFVPQAFSPNNDMENELLMVHGIQGTKVLVFKVFDQWGEQLFEASDFLVNDRNIGWDGIFKGNTMPGGNYMWMVEAEYITGEKELLKGSSLLIR